MFAKIVMPSKALRKRFIRNLQIKEAKENSGKSVEKIEENRNKRRKGFLGELRVKAALWFKLPRNYILMNNVVLELKPDFYNEFDHLVLSPQGIFIIDTKTWEKSWDIDPENGWYRIENGVSQKWKDNPVEQNRKHVIHLKEWAREHFDEFRSEKEFVVYPMNVLLNGKINKNYGDTTIVSSGSKAVNKIMGIEGNNFTFETLEKLSKVLKNAQPLKHWEWIHENFQIKDVRTVEIKGDKSTMLEVIKVYKSKGFDVSYAQEIEKDTWQFMVKNNIEYVEDKMQELINGIKVERFPVLKSFITRKLIKRSLVLAAACVIAVWGWHNANRISGAVQGAMTSAKSNINLIDKESQQPIQNTIKLEPTMIFNVAEGKTYISVNELNGKGLIEKIFDKGTLLLFFKDRRIEISFPDGTKKDYYSQTNEVKFEVANAYTIIGQGGQQHRRGHYYATYNFENDVLKVDRFNR